MTFWQRLLLCYGEHEAAVSADDLQHLARLHARWTALRAEPDWPAMPAALAAGYVVYHAEAAIAAGDGPAAQRAWREAVALRPDSYGLRVLSADLFSLPAEVPFDQRLPAIRRIRVALERNPVVRSPQPEQMHPRIDQLD